MNRIDRHKQPPFLLRLFFKPHHHHRSVSAEHLVLTGRLDEFTAQSQPGPEEEVQIYTWEDATLNELLSLLSSAEPSVMGQRCSFRLVYADTLRGTFRTKDLGSFMLGKETRDGKRTLEELRFVVGDWVDVAIGAPALDTRRPDAGRSWRGGYDRRDARPYDRPPPRDRWHDGRWEYQRNGRGRPRGGDHYDRRRW